MNLSETWHRVADWDATERECRYLILEARLAFPPQRVWHASPMAAQAWAEAFRRRVSEPAGDVTISTPRTTTTQDQQPQVHQGVMTWTQAEAFAQAEYDRGSQAHATPTSRAYTGADAWVA